MLRLFESDEQNKTKPLRAMAFLLEHFVALSPAVNRGNLERFLPYALLHDSQVDISMGKQNYIGTLTAGFDVEQKTNL